MNASSLEAFEVRLDKAEDVLPQEDRRESEKYNNKNLMGQDKDSLVSE